MKLAWHNTLMKPKAPLSHLILDSLDEFRLQTAKPDALIQLSLLALLVGLITGATIVAFIVLIDTSLSLWLPGNATENFEDLPHLSRFIAPVLGSLLISVVYIAIAKPGHSVGVVNVIERLRYHEGYLRLRAFILQFIGAIIALASGHSMGREGPSIHIGGFVGSYFSQIIGLPNNAMRTLVACGVAAAISAAFNTPLAGVIFAMEIIILEYTFSSFIPIIISAVAATGISRTYLGDDLIFVTESIPSLSLSEIPFVILLGVLVGIASTIFTTTIRVTTHLTQSLNFSIRFMIAGLVTGSIAVFVPQIMGLGYDTLNSAILGELSTSLLFVILVAKLLATAISVGCSIPAGLIGPSLVIGAVGGSFMALFLHHTLEIPIENISLYALIGMSAMMGACLQAPLAALTAVFEITAHHAVIWPSMLAIVIAQLICRQLFKQPPVFDLLLHIRGLDFNEYPITQSLQRTGIAKAMNRDFRLLTQITTLNEVKEAIKHNPQWICIMQDKQPAGLLRGIDLIQHLEKNQSEDSINLLQIPAKRLQIETIDIRATLAKTREIFNKNNAEALCITHWNVNATRYIYGVITRDQFEELYMR